MGLIWTNASQAGPKHRPSSSECLKSSQDLSVVDNAAKRSRSCEREVSAARVGVHNRHRLDMVVLEGNIDEGDVSRGR
jgi:hypothetical protein